MAESLPVDAIVDALRGHARAIEQGASEEVVWAEAEAVRTAVRAYADAVFAISGHGPLFEGLYDDLDDDVDVEEFPADVMRLSVTGRWDYLVRDEAALRAFAVETMLSASPSRSDDDVSDHASDAGSSLESVLAEEIDRYPGLESAGAGWTVAPISRTLFEMTADERDRTGY